MPQAFINGVFLEVSKDRDAGKSMHQIPKVEQYQVEVPEEKKVQPAIEKEKSVAPLRFYSSESSGVDIGYILRQRRSIKTPVAVHGRPAASRAVPVNHHGSTFLVPSKRKLSS